MASVPLISQTQCWRWWAARPSYCWHPSEEVHIWSLHGAASIRVIISAGRGAASNRVITHQPEWQRRTLHLPKTRRISLRQERRQRVAAVPCYSWTSCYSGKRRLDQWTSRNQMDLLLLGSECQPPPSPHPATLEDHLVGREHHKESHLLHGELLFDQEMNRVLETLQQHFEKPTSDSLHFYGISNVKIQTSHAPLRDQVGLQETHPGFCASAYSTLRNFILICL